MTPPRLRSPLWLAAALFAFAALLYANTARNGFVLDDQALVESNPLIQDIRNVPTLFASDYWAPGPRTGLYRPLVTTSLALNFSLGGRNPMGYHLVNVVLHALVSVLVWGFFRRLSSDALLAGAAAFLFAAHALHTEAVANVAGRGELLAGLFLLASLLAYSVRGSGYLYALSLGAYLLALLSKESALTLLGMIVLYDLVHRGDPDARLAAALRELLRERWRIYAGYLAVTFLYLGARFLALGPDAALPPLPQSDNPLVALDLPWRLVNALQVSLRYLGLLLFPLRLSYDYSYNQIPLLVSFADPRVWGVLALCGAFLVGWIYSYRRWNTLFFALGFSLASFSLVSNLVIPIGTILGERLMYVPSVGFCLAVGLLLREACKRLPVPAHTTSAIFLALLVGITSLHSLRTLARNADWQSNERLYLHDVQVVPRSTKALINAAYALSGTGREDEAVTLLESAVRAGVRGPVIYNNLGILLVDRELDVARGIRLLEQAVQSKPRDAEFLDSLGWGYYKAGRLKEARAHLQRSLELDDRSPSAPARRARLRQIEQALGSSPPTRPDHRRRGP